MIKHTKIILDSVASDLSNCPYLFWSDIYTPQPLYNTVHYNTFLDITRFKDGSQKCIDYIEK